MSPTTSADDLKFVVQKPVGKLIYKQETIVRDQIFSVLAKVMKANINFSVEEAFVYIFDRYTFDFDALMKCINGPYIPRPLPETLSRSSFLHISMISVISLNVNFSNVKYKDIAPMVGLDPDQRLKDVGGFSVDRARITNDLFKRIIDKIDFRYWLLGPPYTHENEVTRSRLMAPVSLYHFFESSQLPFYH
jgi:hypothetical protein